MQSLFKFSQKAALAAALVLSFGAAHAADRSTNHAAYNTIGRDATPAEVKAWDIDVRPDGTGLPDGSGLVDASRNSLAAEAVMAANAVAQSLVGRTVADVERDLILDTLDHCLGNRTHAANILGISIRTLRNKLNQYADEGAFIPAPGEQRPNAA